jgi:hypothetical protein
MITNKDAYVRLEKASEDALEAAEKAISARARTKLLDLSKAFDAELTDMVTRGLVGSGEPYRPLTEDLRNLKSEIDTVVKNTAQFVETAERMAQIGTSFARVLALL